MRVFFEPARLFSGGVTIEVAPDTCTALTMAGVSIEVLTHHVDGGGDYYVDTTDASYTSGTKYRLRIDSTVAGHSVTKDDNWQHVLPAGFVPDMTPPGPPTIGQPIVSSSSAAFPHIPPSDADYDHTVIFCFPVNSGSYLSGTGSGSNITVGVMASTSYIGIGVAYDTAGNPSIPSNAVLFTTHQGSTASIAKPWYLKLFVSDEDVQHSNGPWLFNPTANKGVLEAGSDLAPMAQGLNCRFRLECHHGIWKPLLSLSVRWIDSATPPFGLINRRENR